MKKEMLFNAAKKYGTPLYVFDLDILKEQTERIRAGVGPENFGFAGNCKFHRKNYLFQVL